MAAEPSMIGTLGGNAPSRLPQALSAGTGGTPFSLKAW